jgi:hypothetical protein
MKKIVYKILILSFISTNVFAIELAAEDTICVPNNNRLLNHKFVIKENGNLEIWYKNTNKTLKNVCKDGPFAINCRWHSSRSMTVYNDSLTGVLKTANSNLRRVSIICD